MEDDQSQMPAGERRRTRVAVIGSGLAGLTAAHLLSVVPPQGALSVHVFDKGDELGMDSASISIKDETGSYRVDVPMRSINSGSHRRVKRLYEYLKVPLVKSDFSYSFSRIRPSSVLPQNPRSPTQSISSVDHSRSSTPLPPYSDKDHGAINQDLRRRRHRAPSESPPRAYHSTTTLLYEGSSGLRWPPAAIPSSLAIATGSLPALLSSTWARSRYIIHLLLFAISYLQLLVLSCLYVASGLTRQRRSLRVPFGHVRNVASEPLENWCQRHRISRIMQEEVLIPLMAAVATVGVDEARRMPIGEVLEYIASTFSSAHYTTAPTFGVRGIVRRLIAPVPVGNIHVSAQIHRITHNIDPARAPYTIHYRIGSNRGNTEATVELDVDYIVMATQANQAATLLDSLAESSPTSSPLHMTLDALRTFTYLQALVVNHTDESFLPRDQSDRRDLNLAAFGRNCAKAVSDGPQTWKTHLPAGSVETTHIVVPQPPTLAPEPSCPRLILQTTNPLRPVDPTKVLSSSWFSRAFVTAQSKDVLPAFLLDKRAGATFGRGTLQGLLLGAPDVHKQRSGGIFFCGSWCAPGIPLLEGCVSSAELVVQELLSRERIRVAKWPF
ncbi:uncharacterized protein JCM15063_005223 [Sporobolomyces koalae]|uniref:uncharacterized protein n=1 Tax=Sporobolomyces koalae TaxID=500713 RepID=UPI00317BF493